MFREFARYFVTILQSREIIVILCDEKVSYDFVEKNIFVELVISNVIVYELREREREREKCSVSRTFGYDEIYRIL